MLLYKLYYNYKCVGYRLEEVYAVKDYKTVKIALDMPLFWQKGLFQKYYLRTKCRIRVHYLY